MQLRAEEAHEAPSAVLSHIKSVRVPSAFVLCDLHPYLDDPKNIRCLKDIALSSIRHKIVLLSHQLTLRAEL
ncbi:MAG: hypothetical protein ACI9Y1_002182 [Lentisphaeria bacterium]